MINLHKNHRLWITSSALLMALAVPKLSTAALLNDKLELPQISYNLQDPTTTNYNAVDNTLVVNSLPVSLSLPNLRPIFINPVSGGEEHFIINISVDETGALIGGNPGHDLYVYGEVDVPNVGTVSGKLLTGEVSAFGYLNSSTNNDLVDFNFTITGGLLQNLFPTGVVSVSQIMETSSFKGDFTIDFEGESKGTLGAIPATTAIIGDRVWSDLNADGIQNCTDGGANDANFPADGIIGNAGDFGAECDAGVANVTVNLLTAGDDGYCGSSDEAFVATQTTDANGFYRFNSVQPGSYCVSIVKPAGTECTIDNMGGDNLADSDFIDQGDGTCQTVDVDQNPIVVAAGDKDLSFDAGLVGSSASLGDRVWSDLNADGIQNCIDGGANDTNFPADGVLGNAGDEGAECGSGLANVTVNLLSTGPDGFCGTGNEMIVATQTTDINGFYLFENAEPGAYCVSIITPAGYACTIDNMGGDDFADSDFVDQGDGSCQSVDANQNPIDLLPGDNNLSIDAGVIRLQAALGDRVWNDLNLDGIQNCTDGGANNPSFPADGVLGNLGDSGTECNSGIANVTVNLLSTGSDGECGTTDEMIVTSQTTDSNGFYLFDDITPGNYCIAVVKPAGYECTADNMGNDDVADSDVVDQGDGTCQTVFANQNSIEVIAGINNITFDAGLVSSMASLGDRVWEDLNGNGIQECADTNGNGIVGDTGDMGAECGAGIAGVGVSLLENFDGDASCTSGDELVIANTTTDSNGFYLFSDLIAGNYCVEYTLPNGYVYTLQNQGDTTFDSDADAVTGRTANVDVMTNQTNLSVDAGVIAPASIGDTVWNDLDRNGLFVDELGVAGISVALFNCTNTPVTDIYGNPVLPTVTDSNGLYNFGNLKPGGYTVKFTTSAGLEFTTAVVGPDVMDSDAENFNQDGTMGTTRCITLASGENNTNIDAGIRSINESRIGDFVWNDTNANGIQDLNELSNGISGVPVELMMCDANNIQTSTGITTNTNASGLYFFEGLSAGSYAVKFDLAYLTQAGYIVSPRFVGMSTDVDSDVNPSNGTSECIDLGVRDQNLTLDAGVYLPASLGDQVWLDSDSNGVLNNENGLDGVMVELFDCSNNSVFDIFGNEVTSVFTNSTGMYNFTDLVPGNYRVKFTAPSGLSFTNANVGIDETIDSDAENFDGDMGTTTCITLGSGEQNIDVDAGFVAPLAQCALDINATCAIIPSLQPVDFVCSDAKDLDTLSMIWDGQDNVNIVAYYGKTDDTELTTRSNVNNGDVVTISGFAGAGNDIDWEVFNANGDSLGTSRFHMSCSDSGMNGPEDCGAPQGNSKNNEAGLLNSWLLDGLAGENGVALVCNSPTDPIATAETCAYEMPTNASCDSKPVNVSLRYLGGDCVISNTQGGKAECIVGGTAGDNVRIKVSNGKTGGKAKVFLDTVQANVTIGDVVTATSAAANENDFDANTIIEIFSATGNLVQKVAMHTSCSLPLSLGDQYGAVDLVAMDTKSGQSISAGVEMLYNYTIVNNSTERFVDDASDSFGPLGKLDLAAQGGSAELTRTQFVLPGVDNVFNNTLTVTGNLRPSGIACSAQDTVPLTVVVPEKPSTPEQVLTCSDIKPLTELSMVWNGANGTTVTTAAGQVFENLQKGNLINFIVDRDTYGNDFAVTLSGAVSGSSAFHLSCSDDFMDGSDDCGSAQGNNKNDDNNLVNSFALNGMTGETGSFSCDLTNTGVVEAVLGAPSSGSVGAVRAEFKDLKKKEYKFYIHNDSNEDVFIERISVDWPTSVNGDLVEIKNGGDKIYDTETQASPVRVSSWEKSQDKRKIKADDKNEIKIKFDDKVDKNLNKYSVEIELSTGEVITLK
ncbi:SdrD B-like domain-containing protein [Cognaticolwellia beringensis]|nr:SdrD B-like domain-containing protein [Cognaticolwellia beringensis]